jgi:hypothetical protein
MEDRELMRTRSIACPDSAARRGEEANEYTVHLDALFKNVVSVNVIDAKELPSITVEPQSGQGLRQRARPRPEAVTAFAVYVAWFLQMVPDPA